MFAVVFAIVTLWTPDAVATPAAHIGDKLPAAASVTGITSSMQLDATRPVIEVCTFGGGSLDGASFAHAADVMRAASLPACRSPFNAEQQRAMIGTYVPSLATSWALPAFAMLRHAPILVSSPPVFVTSSSNFTPQTIFFAAPTMQRSAFRVPLGFSGVTRFSGSVGVASSTSGASRSSAVVSHRPVAHVSR